MSYSISGSGHGADKAKVKDAFAGFVAGLDEATSESGTKFQGTLSGSESLPDGGYDSFTFTAEGIRLEAAAGAGADGPSVEPEAEAEAEPEAG